MTCLKICLVCSTSNSGASVGGGDRHLSSPPSKYSKTEGRGHLDSPAAHPLLFLAFWLSPRDKWLTEKDSFIMRIIYDLFQLYDIAMLALLHDRDLALDLVLGGPQLLRHGTGPDAGVRSPSVVLLCVHA